MNIRMASRFVAVAAISAQVVFCLAEETNTERLWRPDDQMRFVWATVDPILPDLVRQGFNAIITCTGPAYDLEKDAPVANLEAFCSKRKKRLDFIHSLGLTLFEQPPYAQDRKSVV